MIKSLKEALDYYESKIWECVELEGKLGKIGYKLTSQKREEKLLELSNHRVAVKAIEEALDLDFNEKARIRKKIFEAIDSLRS
ncbi:MAG: hypothetical protein AAB652_02045 [Patescibacteria group bacterium]